MISRPTIDLTTKPLLGRISLRHSCFTTLALIGLAMLVLSVDDCGGGIRPYGKMFKAARSELSPIALARDQPLNCGGRSLLCP